MGLSIAETTQGYSKQGAQAFINDLNTKAITETENILRNQKGAVKTAIRSGWAGKSEEAFEANFDKYVEETCKALEELKKGMEAKLQEINANFDELDNSLVDEV